MNLDVAHGCALYELFWRFNDALDANDALLLQVVCGPLYHLLADLSGLDEQERLHGVIALTEVEEDFVSLCAERRDPSAEEDRLVLEGGGEGANGGVGSTWSVLRLAEGPEAVEF